MRAPYTGVSRMPSPSGRVCCSRRFLPKVGVVRAIRVCTTSCLATSETSVSMCVQVSVQTPECVGAGHTPYLLSLNPRETKHMGKEMINS